MPKAFYSIMLFLHKKSVKNYQKSKEAKLNEVSAPLNKATNSLAKANVKQDK
jgi:hypothetical protein